MDFWALLMSKRVNLLPISLLVNLVVVCIDFWFKNEIETITKSSIVHLILLQRDILDEIKL